MNPFESWTSEMFLATSQVAAGFVTALATIALVCVTVVLAKATKRMARASSQPLVTATIEPNIWSMLHCDIVVENSGNAPAYNVVVKISPEPNQGEHREEGQLPLQNISVLRPGQKMTSFLTDANLVLDNVYRIDVSWNRDPNDRSVESIAYDHYLPKDISRLGAWSPEIEIAEQVKKLREDWKQIASGFRKLPVNAFGRTDREEERKRIDEIRQTGGTNKK